MNRLDTKTRIRVVSALVEGCSLRSTCRMTGVAMGTVLKLLTELGQACDDYQDRAIFGLKTKRLKCDEIWSFCYAKWPISQGGMRSVRERASAIRAIS